MCIHKLNSNVNVYHSSWHHRYIKCTYLHGSLLESCLFIYYKFIIIFHMEHSTSKNIKMGLTCDSFVDLFRLYVSFLILLYVLYFRVISATAPESLNFYILYTLILNLFLSAKISLNLFSLASLVQFLTKS